MTVGELKGFIGRYDISLDTMVMTERDGKMENIQVLYNEFEHCMYIISDQKTLNQRGT